MIETQVTVRKYNINWLKGKEKEFIELLSAQDNEDFFANQFIIDIRDQFDMTNELLWNCLLPYFIMAALDIYYFMRVFNTG